MNNLVKNVGIWAVILMVVLVVVKQFDARQPGKDAVSYSEFMDSAKSGKVESATVEGRKITWTSTDKKKFTTYSPGDIWMVGDLLKYGVKVDSKQEEEQSFLSQVFISWFPMLLLIGVWIFFMRQMQGGGRGGAFSFGKSKARMLDEANNTVTFADVAGCDEAKEEVAELVEFLRDPSKFQKLGGRIPARRADGRKPWHRQDAAGQGHCGRGQGAVLLDLRIGLRRDVRRRGRGARARHVRAGEEERAVHRVHRRNRRGRPAARRRPRRRQRRARADAEPAAGGDGRLRRQRRRHRHRRHQPAGRARPGADAPGSLRPAGGRAAAGHPRPRADPAGAHAQGADVARRQGRHHRARHAGHVRRGSRQPRQRGGAVRRAVEQAPGRHVRLRARQGQDHHGRRAALDRDARGGAPQHRVPRIRPRDRRGAAAQDRSGAQGHDHPARPRAGRDDAAPGTRTATAWTATTC